MIPLIFHLIFFCFSIDQSQQRKIFQEELDKIEYLEKKLNETLEKLDEYVQAKERSITTSQSEDLVSQLEELFNTTEQVISNSKSNSTRVFSLIPLTMVKIDYNEVESKCDFEYPGFFVPSDYPTLTYQPITKLASNPIGVFFYNLTNQACEANELKFTFYDGPNVSPSQTIHLNQNSYNATYNIDGIDDFDMLEVTVNAKVGTSSQTCIPNFILYTNSENN